MSETATRAVPGGCRITRAPASRALTSRMMEDVISISRLLDVNPDGSLVGSVPYPSQASWPAPQNYCVSCVTSKSVATETEPAPSSPPVSMEVTRLEDMCRDLQRQNQKLEKALNKYRHKLENKKSGYRQLKERIRLLKGEHQSLQVELDKLRGEQRLQLELNRRMEGTNEAAKILTNSFVEWMKKFGVLSPERVPDLASFETKECVIEKLDEKLEFLSSLSISICEKFETSMSTKERLEQDIAVLKEAVTKQSRESEVSLPRGPPTPPPDQVAAVVDTSQVQQEIDDTTTPSCLTPCSGVPEHGVNEAAPEFTCLCGQKYQTRPSLNVHILSTNQTRFMCTSCGRQFRFLYEMKRHCESCFLNNSAQRIFGCCGCSDSFETAEEARLHWEGSLHVLSDSPAAASLSDLGHSEAEEVTESQRAQQMDQANGTCSSDNTHRKHKSFEETMLHGLNTSVTFAITCICGEEFNTHQGLILHIKRQSSFGSQTRVNPDARNFECGICKTRFFWAAVLCRHLKRFHQISTQAVKCKRCGVVLGSLQKFCQHGKSVHKLSVVSIGQDLDSSPHRRIIPSQNQTRGPPFSRGRLQNLDKSKTVNKSAPRVSNVSATNESCNSNVIVHAHDISKTEDVCKCGYKFKSRRNLLQHIKVKTSEPKHTCTICCQYRHYRRDYVLRHMASQHKTELQGLTPQRFLVEQARLRVKPKSGVTKCNRCDKNFPTVSALLQHMKNTHKTQLKPIRGAPNASTMKSANRGSFEIGHSSSAIESSVLTAFAQKSLTSVLTKDVAVNQTAAHQPGYSTQEHGVDLSRNDEPGLWCKCSMKFTKELYLMNHINFYSISLKNWVPPRFGRRADAEEEGHSPQAVDEYIFTDDEVKGVENGATQGASYRGWIDKRVGEQGKCKNKMNYQTTGRWTCEYCHVVCRTRDVLRKHIARIHKGMRRSNKFQGGRDSGK